MAGHFLARTEEDKYYWKWMLVALHNSLQGFMACALTGGDGLAILKDRVAQKWLTVQQDGLPLPHEQLDTFLNLYKKIKSAQMLFNSGSKQFIPRGRQDWSVRKLNRLRNHFIHFTPKSWVLEVSDLPKISRDCIQVIRFLVYKSGNVDGLKETAAMDFSEEINNQLDRLTKLEAIYKM